MDFVADLALDRDKPRDVHQHRVVPADVPAGKPDGARDDEDPYRCLQSPRQPSDAMIDTVREGDQVHIVVNRDERCDLRPSMKTLGGAEVIVRGDRG